MTDRRLSLDTLAVHAGVEPDPVAGAVMTPIYQNTTYQQSEPGVHKGYDYSRGDNPTRTPLQASLTALEGGKAALVFSSGMSAIDTVLNTLSSGDHVIAGHDLYGGTYRLFMQVARRRGLEFVFLELRDEGELRAAITPQTKLIIFETPTNPMLQIFDIAMIARVAREAGVLTVMDNTLMSPVFQSPLEFGIDIALHSVTKFLNGHSDLIMGCLVLGERAYGDGGPESLYGRLKFLQNAVGAVPSPFECFLALRGIKTLALRMERHQANAQRIAEWLEGHPKVETVLYPGLKSHPQHELGRRQMRGSGGMVTFLIRGDIEACKRLLGAVEIFALAESLGGVESLIEHPGIMTHSSMPAALRHEIGVLDNMIRISVGIESADDLIADLDRAMGAI